MKNLIYVLLFCIFPYAYSSPVTKTATANATIQSGGPSGSPWFHNAQVPGSFQSYGISTYNFSPADFGLTTVTGVSSLEVSYMQSNAGFTTDGPLEFFISFDTTVGSGDFSGLTHNGTGSGILDTEFSDSPSSQSLGTGTFTEVSDGTVDTYTLAVSGVTETAFMNAINNGNPFSILITAPSGSTAATYAGIESFDYASNSSSGIEPDNKKTHFSITAIPEPNTVLLLIVGVVGLICHKINRRNGMRRI